MSPLPQRPEPTPNCRTVRIGLLIVGGLLAILGGMHGFGLRINLTSSFPVGVWRLGAATLDRGRMVVVSPWCGNDVYEWGRAHGYIGRGNEQEKTPPLLKRIVAVAGDQVAISDDGVRVNGALVPNSRALKTDSCGTEIPNIARGGPVASGTVWILSDYTERSFDSRYFGPVPTDAIVASAEPICTW